MKRHLTNDDHLTNDEMLNQLYGLGGVEEGLHLAECVDCTHRYAAFERKRAEMAAESAVELAPSDRAAQRRAVYARLGEAPRKQARWTSALAAAALLAMVLFLYHPSTPVISRSTTPAHADLGDDQLFSDVYSIEESAEPRAAAPIQGLFETASMPSLEDDGQN
jgi:predicted anti-sigma-YlaC factor YlaD